MDAGTRRETVKSGLTVTEQPVVLCSNPQGAWVPGEQRVLGFSRLFHTVVPVMKKNQITEGQKSPTRAVCLMES